MLVLDVSDEPEEVRRGACDEVGDPKVPFRCSRQTGRPLIRALLQRGGMENRCGAYDEKGIFISSRLRGNDCASFRQPITENDDDDIIKELLVDSSTSPKTPPGRGTCPLAGGFAVKWHHTYGFAAKWHRREIIEGVGGEAQKKAALPHSRIPNQ
ncbi:hypothetical protein M5K25_022733 [Dendrobium thyrsiflorum]|uniref:Uncharacterized protein n=1 Tax=Dendrobium thyrsiflorum TaxID=117978 RepID=A0ABD0UDK0_DENTH